MNTVTTKHPIEIENSETATYGQQHNKQIEQLTFIEDTYLNLRCLELEFNSIEEQEAFLANHESSLPNDSQISCCITNFLYKEADFVVITKRDSDVDYQLYITFKRDDWHSDLSLDNFCGILRSRLNQQGLTCKLEMSEQFGVYMSITRTFSIDTLIQHRVRHLSQSILVLQNTILR